MKTNPNQTLQDAMIAEQSGWMTIARTNIKPSTPMSKPYRHVLRHALDGDGDSEYVVHTQTTDDDAYHLGFYTNSFESAAARLEERAKRDGLMVK